MPPALDLGIALTDLAAFAASMLTYEQVRNGELHHLRTFPQHVPLQVAKSRCVLSSVCVVVHDGGRSINGTPRNGDS